MSPRRYAVEQLLAAFALTAAGICAAFAIAWQAECRAIDRALALGGAR